MVASDCLSNDFVSQFVTATKGTFEGRSSLTCQSLLEAALEVFVEAILTDHLTATG